MRISIVFPLVIQGLLTSSLGFLDVVMVGQLGDFEAASAGIIAQIFFIYIMISFSLSSGSGVFVAQYWATRNLKKIKDYQGIALVLNLAVALIVTILAMTFPEKIVGFYTSDAELNKLTCHFLVIISPCFVFYSITSSFVQILRSSENVIVPLCASVTALIINTILNFMLIFGNFGAPALGLFGAAYATLVARLFEVLILLGTTYLRGLVAAATIKELTSWNLSDLSKYRKITAPIIIHYSFWIVGINVYTVIYSTLGVAAFAAFAIAVVVEKFSIVVFSSVGNACGIEVGREIGVQQIDQAIKLAKTYLKSVVLIALGLCIFSIPLMYFIRDILNLSAEAEDLLLGVLIVNALASFLKALNIVFNMGIFRAGGDTKFGMVVDLVGVWLLGVPIAFFISRNFDLPIYWLMALVYTEELIKLIVFISRFKSKKWINNLADSKL